VPTGCKIDKAFRQLRSIVSVEIRRKIAPGFDLGKSGPRSISSTKRADRATATGPWRNARAKQRVGAGFMAAEPASGSPLGKKINPIVPKTPTFRVGRGLSNFLRRNGFLAHCSTLRHARRGIGRHDGRSAGLPLKTCVCWCWWRARGNLKVGSTACFKRQKISKKKFHTKEYTKFLDRLPGSTLPAQSSRRCSDTVQRRVSPPMNRPLAGAIRLAARPANQTLSSRHKC
jgi:hypothetical protein